jgi:ABC-type branched-subunit amino acid transport system ATPase component/ABC-type branched-subunit amino acid transport system permease subunit
VKRAVGALAAVGLLTLPFWLANAYHLHVTIMAGIFTILALSLNLLLGYTGQLSLGHAAFFGIGAYTSALLALKLDWPFWLGLVSAAAAAGLAGWAIGRLALKVRGAYFVLVTISFAGVISLVSVNWMELTNGPLGLPGVPAPELPGLSFRTKSAYYYLVLAAAAGAYLLCHRLVHSRLGRAFLALRENEPLAESVGVDPTRTLVLAAVVSAAMAGVAGSLYAHYVRFVSPEVFLFSYTVTMVIMVVAGGKGTLAGPVVGAVLFTALPEVLREAMSWQWQMLAYGVLLVLLVFFLPRGIVSSFGGGLGGPLRGLPPDAGLRGQGRRSDRDASATALVVEDLAVEFGGVVALSGVSFTVRPGTITSLIGPNGAGKTTAFNAITGYLRPRRGRVTFGDARVMGRRPCDIARRGVVRTFQKTSVFPTLSVLDNVLIGLHLRGRAGLAAILAGARAVRAEETVLRHEAEAIIAFVGLEPRRGAVASRLPYGEQRLVELAVALAAQPRVLLLDEPAAGMTGGEKERLVELIRRVREQGVTVFVVEHDMRLVMGVSDTVIVLNHGRVIAEGPPATIQAHPEVIRAYLGSTRA